VDVSDGGKLKNIRALVDAHALMRSQGREVTLELVGPGLGPGDELASYAHTLGCADSVHFRGVLRGDQVTEILAGATLFVHTSLEESFGVSVVEAMVAGVPVIAGVRSGAVPWVLADGDAGLLVDVRKPSELAAGIMRLLDDKDYADRLALRGQEHALSAFDSRTVASAYLDAYDTVGRGRRSRRLVEHA
jgi:glycosyltransferase involved in cell wall biosynthesis